MRNYEVAFIVHPDLEEGAFEEVLEIVKGWIIDGGGNITDIDLWGKRRMAYEIRKQNEGQYVCMQTELEPAFPAELDRKFGLEEPIMRFMVTSSTVVEQAPSE
ncbi:MAG: 30S ribosomal protein S6 [Chloroflexi bacterium]|nr:30S ribosomal protein S6 [Chloroflexota bacterium]